MNKVKAFLVEVLHYFSVHTKELASAAVIAEEATGNADLVDLTNSVATSVQTSATILDNVMEGK